MNEDFWKTVEVRRPYSRKARQTGILNIALLFGTAAIALSLIITPMVAGKNREPRLAQIPDNFDMITTGSIKPARRLIPFVVVFFSRRRVRFALLKDMETTAAADCTCSTAVRPVPVFRHEMSLFHMFRQHSSLRNCFHH